jgi:hypothetical protein
MRRCCPDRSRCAHNGTAGAWLGLCASIKPPLLLFVPAFARIRRTRAATTLAGVVVALFACGLALYGTEAHREWFARLASVTWTEHYMNMSVLGLLERSLSVSNWGQTPVVDAPALIVPVWIVMAGGLAAITLVRLPRLATIDEQLLLVTVATLLASPIAWVYYQWLLVPSLAGTLTRPVRSPLRIALLISSLAGLMTPLFVPWTAAPSSGLGTFTAGSIYCWSLLALWLFAGSHDRLRASNGTG